ncbi:MAG: PEGA domain-containing protein [Thiobacillus sp.]|nr:PEGA domain-containing protein [Thiobacillus sp.]
MRKIHSPNIKWLGLLAAAALSGCAGTGGGSETPSGQIRITAEPAGAIAYADGAELGATPLAIVPGNHFRSGFAGLSYRYVGKLSIKKAGCDTWTTDVNDAILAKDIHARLKCDPNYQPAAAAPAPGTPAGTATGDQTIERLERIESLRKKGLISEEEYKASRARIIEKL